MVEVLALLVGVTLPVSLLFVVVRRGKHQLDAAIAYRQVARNLNLMVDTRGVCVQGLLGERRLWVGEVMVGHGTERRTAIWGVLDLERPLGLGIQVRRRGLSTRVFRRRRAPGVELGDPALQDRLEVSGDDPARVRTLVCHPGVSEALLAVLDHWPDLVVTDSAVRVHLEKPLTTERDLQRLVEGMVALADALASARREVEAPTYLADVVKRWGELATEEGLALQQWLPALHGELEGCQVSLCAYRVGDGYLADLRLYFPPHSVTGIRVGPQQEPDGYWSVGQDIQCGDPAFDPEFVVKGWDPDRVRELLTAEVRQALLRCLELGPTRLEDARLHLRALPLDKEVCRKALNAVREVARTLRWM